MKTRFALLLVLSLCLIVVFSSCATNRSSSKAEPAAQAPAVEVPPTSKFAKIEIGMARPEVHEKIGASSDFKVIASGKAWIPFYYGSDRTRTIDYYKKEGRLVYAGGNNRLIEIVYDPNEDGYRD